MEVSNALLIVGLVLLVLVFHKQISYLIDSLNYTAASVFTGDDMEHLNIKQVDARDMKILDSKLEHMTPAAAEPTLIPPGQTSDVMTVLGYTGSQPWGEVIKATELDPSTFVNHREFVKDVRRFSSGANFTSVTDDNTNIDFVGFVGLRRPTHVPIGDTARQQPDIDQSVLQRNQRFSWTNGPNFTGNYNWSGSESGDE